MRSTLRRKLRRWRRYGARPARGAWKPGFAALAIATSCAAPAMAAPAWNPPREVSDADSAPLNLAAAAGIGPTGGGVLLWHSPKGVEAVVRAAGPRFRTPRPIPGSTPSMPDP